MSRKTFEEITEEAISVDNIEELFKCWREAHEAEVEEWTCKSEGEFLETVSYSFDELHHENSEKLKANGISLNKIMSEAFNYDGYIGEKVEKSFSTVFLLKEENNISDLFKDYSDGNRKEEIPRVYNSFVKKFVDGNGKPTILQRLGVIADRILNNNMKFDADSFDNTNSEEILEKSREALAEIAYININKRGGGAGSNNNKLIAYTKKYKKYIANEIQILAGEEPVVNIIIFGPDVFGKDIAKILKDTLQQSKKKYTFYSSPHPAWRKYKENHKKNGNLKLIENSLSESRVTNAP